MKKVLSDTSEWSIDLINRYDREIARIAGDFKLDKIEKKRDPLSLEITCSGFEKMELKIDQEDSIDLGTIFIK